MADFAKRLGVDKNPIAGSLSFEQSLDENGCIVLTNVWETKKDYDNFIRDRAGPLMGELRIPKPTITVTML